MKEFITFTVAAVLTIAIAVVWGVSAAANWHVGSTWGDNTPWNFVFFTMTSSNLWASASLAIDVLKAFCLFMAFTAIANKQKREATVLLLIWVACTGWSLSSATGYAAISHATMIDTRSQAATNWEQLEKEIKTLEGRRKWVPDTRPYETVQADMAGRTTAYLFTRSKGCTDITVKDSRAFCEDLSKLRQEEVSAKAGAELDKKLENLRQEQKALKKIGSADPWADLMASFFGSTPMKVSSGRSLSIAFLIEFISAVGLWPIWSVAMWRLRKSPEPPRAAKDIPAPEVAPKVEALAVAVSEPVQLPMQKPIPSKPRLVTEDWAPEPPSTSKKEHRLGEAVAAAKEFAAECLELKDLGRETRKVKGKSGKVTYALGGPSADCGGMHSKAIRKLFKEWVTGHKKWGHLATIHSNTLGEALCSFIDTGRRADGRWYGATLKISQPMKLRTTG